MPEIITPVTSTASPDAPDRRQLTAPNDVTAAVAVASIPAMTSESIVHIQSLSTPANAGRDDRGTGGSEAPRRDGHRRWQLRPPAVLHAETVAGWSSSADEAGRWVSNAVHPFPASTVATWWQRPDVQPWLLVDPHGVPVGYGEIWDGADEDEVELARPLVDPHRRRQGVGTLLGDQLLTRARRNGRAGCFLRVAPDNTAELTLYRSAGFTDVDPAHADAWNQQQPVDYVWLQQALNTH